MQVIVFQLNDLYFGLSTESVEEITSSLKSTLVPKSDPWVHGLINLRGNVLTLVDMKELLEIDASPENECYNNTIVVKLNDNNIALMVDSVLGVTNVEEEDFHPTTGKENSSVTSLLSVYDRIVNILDLNSLFLEK